MSLCASYVGVCPFTRRGSHSNTSSMSPSIWKPNVKPQYSNRNRQRHYECVLTWRKWSYSFHFFVCFFTSKTNTHLIVLLLYLLRVVIVVIVVVVVEAAVETVLFPQRSGDDLLLDKQSLEELVWETQREITINEVHEAHAGPSVISDQGPGGEQRLADGVDDWRQVLVSRLGEALEEVLGLTGVVLPVLLQQACGQVVDQGLVLTLPVLLVTRLTWDQKI